MKNIYLTLLIILLGFQIELFAQEDGGISIGKGTEDAHSSAILELVSSNKGLLIPRLSSTERHAISSPARGLLVYDTTLSRFQYWNGSIWGNVSGLGFDSGAIEPTNSKEGDLFYNTTVAMLKISVGGLWKEAGSKKQVLQLNETTLKLLEIGIDVGSEVDLSILMQDLSLQGTKLSISGKNTIDLKDIDTDKQTLSLNGTILSITNGGPGVNFASILSTTADKIEVTPVGGIASTNVQAALQELQSEIYSAGGEMNVNADWSVTDSDSDAFILNKPAISGTNTGDQDASNVKLSSGYTKPTSGGALVSGEAIETSLGKLEKGLESAVFGGGEMNVNADWSVTDSGSDAFILNKPAISGTNTGDQDASNVKLSSGYTKPTSGGALVGGEAIETSLGKLEKGLESAVSGGGEMNVNADWSVTDSGSDAFILNKPAITGTNTGDETAATIKTKLGVTILSGSNTGDQDLSGLAKTADVTSALANKVDVVTGKSLSTNDYTTVEQSKLAAISGTNTGDQDASNVKLSSGYTKPTSGGALVSGEAIETSLGKLEKGLESAVSGGGEMNVNADWSVTDSGSDAFIQNKPTISGINTGDETTGTIKTKLGVTTLSGSNTGDQDLSGLAKTADVISALDLKANISDLGTAATKNVGITANSVVQLDADAKLPAVDGSQLTGLPSAPVTSVAGRAGTVTLANTDISGLGTASTKDVGTTANSVVQLDANAKLPAVDGSQLTGLPSAPVTKVAGKTGDVTLAKGDVGLDNVDNTSDAAKPVSTAAQAALDLKANISDLGTAATKNVGTTANSVVQLDADAKLPAVDGSRLTGLPSAPVTSVAGRAGIVTLANTDISGLGTAATLNSGVAAGNVVVLETGAKLPAVDGSQLINLPIKVVNNTNLFSTGTNAAGLNVTATPNNNFLGLNAGNNATGTSSSNFLGKNAGNGATNATNSNFLGESAGSGAISAWNSNFMGYLAGKDASTASRSNFLGEYAGNGSANASFSNFLGSNAGNGATNATYSNFLGYWAGKTATNAANSNFLGESAGSGATNATYSNFLGSSAGKIATEASYSTLIGYRAGYEEATGIHMKSNNIVVGTNITLPNAATNSLNIGGVLFGTGTYGTLTGNPSTAPVAGGKIGIGVAAPTAVLELAAGTTGYAPLKLTTTGAALTTTSQAGAIETAGGHLYFTPTDGAARIQIDGQSLAMGVASATSTATGGTILGGSLSLSVADGTNPGIVSISPQIFGGSKTFTDGIAITNGIINSSNTTANLFNNTVSTLNIGGATMTTTIGSSGAPAITVIASNLKVGTPTVDKITVTTDDGSDLMVAGNAEFDKDVWIQGTLNTPSDARLKTKIETLSGVLEKLNQMRGVSYEFKDQQNYAKGPQVGVIAQELLKVFPELVTKGADGFYAVNYSQLTGVLIQAVKEQQLEIDQLKLQMQKVMKKLGME